MNRFALRAVVFSWAVHATERQLLTLPEAAAQLRVSKRTLERLIAAREFPLPLKVGARSLVPVADLQAYLANLLQLRDRRAST